MVRNLFLLGGLAAIALVWVSMFTGWLNTLSVLYSMTGLSALVSGGVLVSALELLPEVRRDEMKQLGLRVRDRFLRRLLNHRATTPFSLVLVPLGLALTALFGGVRVTSDDAARVAVRRWPVSGKPSPKPFEKVNKGAPLHYLQFSPLWKTDEVEVEVKGLPKRHFALRHWLPTTVELPDGLKEAPVVLLVMSNTAITKVITDPGRLDVKVTDPGGRVHGAKITNYDGRSVWIGCDKDVRVPAEVEDRWKQEAWHDVHRQRRVRTVGTEPPLDLTPGARVEVTVVYGQGLDLVLPAKPFEVGEGGSPNFPQVKEFLDGP
jgi:hypothetical protein